jgi:hypothetical protein
LFDLNLRQLVSIALQFCALAPCLGLFASSPLSQALTLLLNPGGGALLPAAFGAAAAAEVLESAPISDRKSESAEVVADSAAAPILAKLKRLCVN